MHYTYCAFYKLKIKSNQFVLLKSISIIKNPVRLVEFEIKANQIQTTCENFSHRTDLIYIFDC